MEDITASSKPVPRLVSPSPTEVLSISDDSDDDATQSTASGSGLASVQSLLRGHNEANIMRGKSFRYPAVVEVPESPRLVEDSDPANDLETTVEPGADLTKSLNEPVPLTQTSAVLGDEVNDSSTAHKDPEFSQTQTVADNQRLIHISQDSILGVLCHREAGNGTEYCCMVWCRESDVPEEHTNAYEEEGQRWQGLKKRRGGTEDVDIRMLKKARCWANK